MKTNRQTFFKWSIIITIDWNERFFTKTFAAASCSPDGHNITLNIKRIISVRAFPQIHTTEVTWATLGYHTVFTISPSAWYSLTLMTFNLMAQRTCTRAFTSKFSTFSASSETDPKIFPHFPSQKNNIENWGIDPMLQKPQTPTVLAWNITGYATLQLQTRNIYNIYFYSRRHKVL